MKHQCRLLPAVVVLVTLLLPTIGRLAAAAVPRGGPIGSVSCSGGLTLVLRPGIVPPANAPWNKPPARDMPPGPLVERCPVYPGATPSLAVVPARGVEGMFPAYRKSARAEFQVTAGYKAVSAWYVKAIPACGLQLESTMPLQHHLAVVC